MIWKQVTRILVPKQLFCPVSVDKENLFLRLTSETKLHFFPRITLPRIFLSSCFFLNLLDQHSLAFLSSTRSFPECRSCQKNIFFVEKNDLGFFEVGPVLNVLNIRERGNPDAGSRSGCSSAEEHSPWFKY